MSDNTQDLVKLLSIIMQMGMHGGRAQAFMLQGPPGIGKTMGVEAIAAALSERMDVKFPAEIWSAPQIQAEDAAGLPVPDLESGTTRLLPLRIGDRVVPAGRGVLCLDEFGSISPSQEAAYLNLLQGGVLGEKVLPSTIALGAMMNPLDSAANARALSAPASNRFIWLDWKLNPSTWVNYMRGGPGFGATVSILEPGWEAKHGRALRTLMASYINRHPDVLLQEPKGHDSSGPWPSPRSWEAAARVMAAVVSTGEKKTGDLASMAVAGCVGDANAQVFTAWLIDLNLPDPEELLADPKNAPKLFPKRGDHLTITLEAVATAATDKTHKDAKTRWENAWKIIGPVFVEKNDIGLPAAHLMTNYCPPGVKYPPEVRKVVDVMKKSGMLRVS